MSKPTSFTEPSPAEVRQLLTAMEGRRVLVVGDGMLDSYIYGSSSRISPEAPVQIVQVEREENLLGGAANVAKCLVALGAKVTLCCVAGTDAHGAQFIDEANSLGIDTRLVFRDSSRPTTVKTRVVAGRQHVLRIDRDGHARYPQALIDQLVKAVRTAVATHDAVLLSDYDKGVLSEAVCAAAISAAGKKPVLVDPKGSGWSRYSGATVLKPNWREAQSALAALKIDAHLTAGAADRLCEQAAARLREKLNIQHVLLTRSERGLSLAGKDAALSLPSHAKKVQDEAGAGDVVAATTLLALAAQASMPTAAWLGNVAAGAKVAKFGTHTVSDHEIMEALGERLPSSERKVLSAAQAAKLAAELRAAGKKVVFTNGCFDILHYGHVNYLEKARGYGDALIVGINTDASVRRLKGPERPINHEGDRARVIAGQACVDAVVLFEDDTPLELIRAIKPQVLCKGADYKTKQEVVGWDVVEAHGGRVELVPLVDGLSTSNVIARTRQQPARALQPRRRGRAGKLPPRPKKALRQRTRR